MHTKTVEKAFVLDLPDIQRTSAAFIKARDLIYVGSEFCQNIYPSLRDMELLFEKGARRVAVLTAFMTDEGLARAQAAVAGILGEFPGVEVMVNDFGLLAYLNKFHPAAVKGIGRPLSVDFLRMNPAYRAKFFKQHGISRIETDELNMLENLPAKPGFKVSLHYPYKFAAMTRLCPFVGKITLHCGRKCRGKLLRLPVPGCGAVLLARNNAYFAEYQPGKAARADRLVEHSFGAAAGRRPKR